ncbi:TetR/AcrR family transcriptional regulator [Methanimicrococcus blatticola]|uniref:TetR family transcriptional regulator n=1 Tax=Methanimicrococcus blatticola TaxID=91560 RepID=A0A484F662_9EURY|nr:TetR/AcrR family transcriptional regulator [Methanimicrococcus blatticola]MBZ3936003.1 TetR family transcriptional regulator [Methanimicrococcus blatticola]MCC2509384.1 TetR/AcrR family transcriptional regulator [Methanimicrococcus blatticola]TDQ68267.1 TetR family transcriptional regulator [Methanimicrococcus blatticola]
MNSENQGNFEEINTSGEITGKINERRASQNSIIADLRKEQILDAATLTLIEAGYINTSLAKIAKKADISAALIPYYFPTKTELIEKLRAALLQKQENYIHGKVAQAQTPLEMLYIYIRASLTYSEEHKHEYDALMEIIYNGRDENGTPYYKIFGNEDTELLEKILEAVQRKDGFPGMNPVSLAILINGAIRGYTMDANAPDKQDYETYCDELIETVSMLSGFSRKYTYEPIIQ